MSTVGFNGERFVREIHFAFGGTGSGKAADDALPLTSATADVMAFEDGMVIEEVDMDVASALTGVTAVDVGDTADPDGYIAAAAGTVAYVLGAGALVSAAKSRYSADSEMEVAFTGTATAGAMRLIVHGYRLQG